MPDALRRASFGGAVLLSILMAGCATTPASSRSPQDPLEPMNRAVYKFNDTVDRAVTRPIAKAYNDYLPRVMRSGIRNGIDNLAYPTTIVNDLLQAKWRPALNDIGRFLLNSTLGLGGLFDPATMEGLDKNDEDFGQTVGRWGIPSGPYLVLPVIGPTTVRDAVMIYPERYTDLRGYLGDWETKWSLIALGLLETRASLLSVDQVLRHAHDPYVFTRNAYLQRREYQVRDGDVPDEQLEDDLGEEELGLPVKEPQEQTETKQPEAKQP